MPTSIEAEVDVDGSVRLLQPLKVTKKSRAILTLLDAADVQSSNAAETQLAEARFARHFGAINSGDSRAADNDKIDADLIRAYEDAHDGE